MEKHVLEELEEEVRHRLRLAKLERLGDESLSAGTMRNLVAILARLTEHPRIKIKKALEAFEHKCRAIADHPQGIEGWGYVVGTLRGIVRKLLGEPEKKPVSYAMVAHEPFSMEEWRAQMRAAMA